ncbi:MAG: hypothetical protein L3K17_01130 [Thermoplasmata archaeon]|nr:hypothetical protein [Thermoplasmata archaeon]
MLRAETKALGTWTIAALLIMAIVALALPGGLVAFGHANQSHPLAGSASHVAAPTPLASVVAPAVHVAAGNNSSGNISASVVITTTLTGPQDIPVALNWTINVTNTTLDAKNVSQTLLVMNGANVITNLSQPVAAGTTNYTTNIDYGLLTSANYNGGTLPTTPYTFVVWLTALNATNGSVSWVNASSNALTATLLISNVEVLYTSSLPLYSSLPFTIDFTTTFTGNTPTVINRLNVTINLELRFIESGCGSLFGLGAPCETVANETLDTAASGLFNATGVYSYTVSGGDFAAQNFANGQFPYGEYQVIVWTTLANVNDPAQDVRTSAAAEYTYPVFDQNAATFLSPSATSPATAGNVTISVSYIADYLAAANVTVYEGATGTTVVFSAGVVQAGEYAHASSATWSGAAAGEYRLVLAIATAAGAAAGTATFSELFNVTSAASAGGGVVYYNETIYTNTTTTKASGSSFGGLSAGAGAATLLVVGLIIGAIVAFMLGRMMWTGQKPGSPQPWSAKGANECSICHQTFPTEAELKEHSKQAHGKE